MIHSSSSKFVSPFLQGHTKRPRRTARLGTVNFMDFDVPGGLLNDRSGDNATGTATAAGGFVREENVVGRADRIERKIDDHFTRKTRLSVRVCNDYKFLVIQDTRECQHAR